VLNPCRCSSSARINGPGAAQAIRQAASQADPKRRAAAITALAARRDTSALGTLLVAAALPDPDVSRAAWAGLGQTGTEVEQEMMVRLAVRNKPAEAWIYPPADAGDYGMAW